MASALQYQPSDEQLALAGELEPALAALLPISRAHLDGCESADIWRQLDELGILGAGLDESRGGSGLGATELSLIAVSLGRNLASPAILATIGAMGAAVDHHATPRVATGFGGERPLWADEPDANLLLLRDDDRATLHAMPGDADLADDSIWGVALMTGAVGPVLHQLDAAEMQVLRLVDAAALAGIAGAALNMAVDYAKLREQFGRPIGSFQAVKHHCANMAIAARAARDATSFAAVAFDSEREDTAHRIESAFLVAAAAAIDNAGTNIQIHGGIGFSAEADPHLLLKRAQLLAAIGGGLEAAAERVAAASPD
jgi:alkylation response protein AidB-like acyl-CoA dehydrogenase